MLELLTIIGQDSHYGLYQCYFSNKLDLASGYLGQLTLGHAGFMSVGAYTSALCSLYLHFPFLLSLLIGAIAACLIGVVIGIPTLRLKGDYLCIITLAFNEIIRVIMLNLSITNGAKGLMGFQAMNIDFSVYFLSAVITIYVIYCIVKSRHGVLLFLFVKMKQPVNYLVFLHRIIRS